MVPRGSHQGVAATVDVKPALDLPDLLERLEGRSSALIAVLDGVQDPHNLGAVVRNARFHHNRWGIQDVNGSRSVFNGVTAEHNEINGVNFVGGYPISDHFLDGIYDFRSSTIIPGNIENELLVLVCQIDCTSYFFLQSRSETIQATDMT